MPDHKNLTKFILEKNAYVKFFPKMTPLSLDTVENRILVGQALDGDLSPEILACDGERPLAQIKRRRAYLMAAAKELLEIEPGIKFYSI